MKCKCCDATVADDADPTLAAARWGWVIADDPGLGEDGAGRSIPGWFYACFDCSDPDRRDAWASERRAGQTLSQTGLAMRWRRSPGWVRAQGELVTDHGETWARMENSRRRCLGYRLVTPVRAVAT